MGTCAGQGNAEQAVKLLGAEEPFLQRSGAARVHKHAANDASLAVMLREGAPARLLRLLHAGGDACAPWPPDAICIQQ